MTRRTRLVAAAIAAAALATAAAALATVAVLTEEPVRSGPKNESQPAITRTKNGDVLVWTQWPAGKENQSSVYLRRGKKPAVKLNTKGRGYSGDVSPPFVVFQEVVGKNSALRLYRLDKRKRVAMPPGVNTIHWEWRPRISGNWIMFARISAVTTREQMILFNLKTRSKRVLATISNPEYLLVPGQVNGNWAVWYRCSPVCDVYRYHIPSKTRKKLAKPAGPDTIYLWAPAVTKTGVVYTGSGPDGCGNQPHLVRYFGPGDPPTGTPIGSFPPGIDFNGTFARTKGGTVEILYARVTCGNPEKFDVYRTTDPPPAP
jgi:hypothetical protein